MCSLMSCSKGPRNSLLSGIGPKVLCCHLSTCCQAASAGADGQAEGGAWRRVSKPETEIKLICTQIQRSPARLRKKTPETRSRMVQVPGTLLDILSISLCAYSNITTRVIICVLGI
jgi:hypothetical protein